MRTKIALLDFDNSRQQMTLKSDLTSVSCQAANSCMGAEWHYDSATTEFPLVAPFS
jgi:hypothetical protein